MKSLWDFSTPQRLVRPAGLRAIDGGIVHGKQQPGLAFAVAVVRVVMARRGGEEQAFADGKILVVEGKGEVAAFASGGFVRFIEHGQIKRLARRHRRQRWTRIRTAPAWLPDECANLRCPPAGMLIGRTNLQSLPAGLF